MKKLILVALLAGVSTLAIGQTSGKRDLNNAFNYYANGYIDRAKAAIDKCIEADDTKSEAKTWMYRGNIYLMIADGKANPKGKNAEYAALCENASTIAFQSYVKALELDPDVSVQMSIGTPRSGLLYAGQYLVNEAIADVNNQQYAPAFEKAEMAHRANPQEDYTTFIYGYCAEKNGKLDVAKKQYASLVRAKKKENINPYIYLANIYKEENDTARMLNVLKVSEEVFLKDTFNVKIAETSSILYAWAGKNAEAAALMDIALEKDPNNYILLLNYGSELSNQKKYEESEKYLLKAWNLKPDDEYVNYNLGNCYYNNYVDLTKSADAIDDNDEYERVTATANSMLVKSRPYLEKAHQINPKDFNTLFMLKMIYSRLEGTQDLLEEVNKKMSELQK